MFKLDWTNIKSALIYGLLSAFLAMGMYAIQGGDLFSMNWKALLNAGFFGFLIAVVSVVKNLLTTDAGKFLGVVKVIPEINEQ